MLTIQRLIQKLTDFTPLRQEISVPTLEISQVRNGFSFHETPLEQTVYLISAKEMMFPSHFTVHNVYIIFVSEDQMLPEISPNYQTILLSDKNSRTSLYEKIRKLLKTEARISDAHYRLSQCLLKKANMEEILNTGAALLGNPLFLSDTSTRVLQFSGLEQLQQEDDELLQCVIKHGFVTSELFEKYDYASLLPMIEKKEHAFHQKSEYAQKKERLIVKVFIDHRYFGWIVVIPSNRPFADGDREIMDILSQVLSLELERNKIGFALSHRENLLMELLSGHISSLDEFRRRAEGFQWSPKEDFYVMAITFHPSRNQAGCERTITAYKNHLALIYPTYKAICIGDTLLLLLETDDLNAVINNLQGFFHTYQLAAGCSEHFSDILLVNRYYNQAMEILRIGLRYQPEASVFCYWDFYLPYMISRLKTNGDLKSFCLPQIQTLHQYDEKNHTSYIETLRAYVRYRNHIQTAEYLHIHRNTLNYRLQKIDEITHLNLNEGNNLFKIWFSLLILAQES